MKDCFVILPEKCGPGTSPTGDVTSPALADGWSPRYRQFSRIKRAYAGMSILTHLALVHTLLGVRHLWLAGTPHDVSPDVMQLGGRGAVPAPTEWT